MSTSRVCGSHARDERAAAVSGLDHVVYDGRTLALEVGACVFTGTAALAAPNAAGC